MAMSDYYTKKKQEEFLNSKAYENHLKAKNEYKEKSTAKDKFESVSLNFTLLLLACIKFIIRTYLVNHALRLLREALKLPGEQQFPFIKQMMIMTGLILISEKTFSMAMEANLNAISKQTEKHVDKLREESSSNKQFIPQKTKHEDLKNVRSSMVMILGEFVGDMILAYAPYIIASIKSGGTAQDLMQVIISKFRFFFKNALVGAIISIGAVAIAGVTTLLVSKLQSYLKAENEIKEKKKVFMRDYGSFASQLGIFDDVKDYYDIRIDNADKYYGGGKLGPVITNSLSYLSYFAVPLYKLGFTLFNARHSTDVDAVSAFASAFSYTSAQNVTVGDPTMWSTAFDTIKSNTFDKVKDTLIGRNYNQDVSDQDYAEKIKPGKLYIITAPSGKGKSVFLKRLCDEDLGDLGLFKHVKPIPNSKPILLSAFNLNNFQSLISIKAKNNYDAEIDTREAKIQELEQELETSSINGKKINAKSDAEKKKQISKLKSEINNIRDKRTTKDPNYTLFEASRMTIGSIRTKNISARRKMLEDQRDNNKSDKALTKQLEIEIDKQIYREKIAKEILNTLNDMEDNSLDATGLNQQQINEANIRYRENQDISRLSEGQFFRVMLALAISGDRDTICIDEKMSNLDDANKTKIAGLLVQAAEYLKLRILVIDHNMLPKEEAGSIKPCNSLKEQYEWGAKNETLADKFGFIEIGNAGKPIQITQPASPPVDPSKKSPEYEALEETRKRIAGKNKSHGSGIYVS